jgi:hypothetical protein
MKIFSHLILFASLTQLSCSENANAINRKADDGEIAAIKQFEESYYKAVSKYQWDDVLNMMHPKVFDHVPKKEFRRQLQEGFAAEDYNMYIDGYRIDSVSDVVIKGSDKYILLTTHVDGSMVLDPTKFEPGSIDGVACENVKKELGEDAFNINCFSDENKIVFTMIDESYMIYVDRQKKWFTVGNEKEAQDLVKKVIPADIRKKLGK